MPTSQLPNGYEFINVVEMHAELGDRFQIAHAAFRRNAQMGHFVEVRADSPRFSAHQDAPEHCECEHCKEPMTKPILCHEEPASFVRIPKQPVPSRGWGEQYLGFHTQRNETPVGVHALAFSIGRASSATTAYALNSHETGVER